MKRGVLVVSFGTTHDDTREKTIDKLEQEAGHYFQAPVYRAWTSSIIRRILKERGIRDIGEAMEQAKKDGIEELVVLNNLVIDGFENARLKRTLEDLGDQFACCRLGSPLLTRPEDYERVTKGFHRTYPFAPGRAVLLMGHGSQSPANASYEKLREYFIQQQRGDFFIACVEGYPYLEDILPALKDYERVLLLPLMMVAGDHAKNDMLGEENSYRTRLAQAGFEVEYALKGLGEYDFIRQLVLEHAALAQRIVLKESRTGWSIKQS